MLQELEDSNINMKKSVPCSEQTYRFISYFCNNGNPFGATLLLEFPALHSFKEAIEESQRRKYSGDEQLNTMLLIQFPFQKR